jgi:hypothetical protein
VIHPPRCPKAIVIARHLDWHGLCHGFQVESVEQRVAGGGDRPPMIGRVGTPASGSIAGQSFGLVEKPLWPDRVAHGDR